MDRRGGAVFRAPRTRVHMHTSYMYACVRVRVHMGGGDTIQGKVCRTVRAHSRVHTRGLYGATLPPAGEIV